MDSQASVLQGQPGYGEFTGFRSLKRIHEHNVTPQRLKWIWECMMECDYAFDDFTRGKVDFFLAQFADDRNEFYEMGDAGVVVLSNITQHGGSNIHYLVWDRVGLGEKKGPALDVFDYLFFKRKVHHVVGAIPTHNQYAIRHATSIGMRFEGEIREDVLYKGRYYNTHIYGILEQEYPSRRGRLL